MAASRSFVAGVAVMVTVAALFAGASAQLSGCVTSIVGLAPCLGYISGNTSTPSTTCCSQLSSVVKSSPQCLCLVLNGGAAQYGITINQTQALTLPGACTVRTPPVSACAGVRSDWRLLLPVSSLLQLLQDPLLPLSLQPLLLRHRVSGVKTTPSTPAAVGGTSDGSSIKASSSLLPLVLLVGYAAGSFASF
ncbi:hypothetical protein Taro_019456 [Colocasia esculenta]|uniref:Bifunctional inhibitor/plant lipid transfer protein/seed storage helical domain-containing protein n=1 Tax=Colocasia esculenta TaxID=4460 RepID=A0A843UTU9_COLES|nr:hypothetical protein [Colocasia esculenta]